MVFILPYLIGTLKNTYNNLDQGFLQLSIQSVENSDR
jgi:hypothetical protein